MKHLFIQVLVLIISIGGCVQHRPQLGLKSRTLPPTSQQTVEGFYPDIFEACETTLKKNKYYITYIAFDQGLIKATKRLPVTGWSKVGKALWDQPTHVLGSILHLKLSILTKDENTTNIDISIKETKRTRHKSNTWILNEALTKTGFKYREKTYLYLKESHYRELFSSIRQYLATLNATHQECINSKTDTAKLSSGKGHD